MGTTVSDRQPSREIILERITAPQAPNVSFRARKSMLMLLIQHVLDVLINKMRVVCLMAIVLATSVSDAEWGSSGKMTIPLGTRNDGGRALAYQTDGKLVVAGYATQIPFHYQALTLTRFHPDGQLDDSFGTSGTTYVKFHGGYAILHCLLIESNGKIVSVGRYWNEAPQGYEVIVGRFNTNGTLDGSFDSDGLASFHYGAGDFGRSIVAQSDGKYVIGAYTNQGTDYNFLLMRLLTDGSLDGTFGTTGAVTTPVGSGDDVGYSVTLDTTGRILFAGRAHNGSNNDFALLRFLTNGSLDTTFSSDGKDSWAIGSGDDTAFTLAEAPDGSIVVAGRSHNGSNYDFAIANYGSTGSHDASTRFPILTGADSGHSLHVDSNNERFLVGHAYGSNWEFAMINTQLSNNPFVPDTNYNTNGYTTTRVGSDDAIATAVAVQSDDKIIAVGYANDNFDFVIARHLEGGGRDTTFSSDGVATISLGSGDDAAYTVTVQNTNQRIVVAGAGHNGSNHDFGLIRLLTTGSVDTTFNSDGVLLTPIGSSNDIAYAVALQSDGKILIAGDTDNGSNNDFAIARYLTTGIIDTTFGSDGIATMAAGSSHDGLRSIVFTSGGAIYVGGYSVVTSDRQFAIAKFTSGGVRDTTFDSDGLTLASFASGGDDIIFGMALDTTNKLVVGGHVGDTSSFGFARFLTSGAIDTTFSSDGKMSVAVHSDGSELYEIILENDGQIIGIGKTLQREENLGMTRINTDGTLDTSFGSNGTYISSFTSKSETAIGATMDSNDRVITAGTAFSTHYDMLITRFTNATGPSDTLDATFGTNGKIITGIGSGDDKAFAVTIDNGVFIMAGKTHNGSDSDFGLVRVYKSGAVAGSGTLDEGFATNGAAITDISGDDEAFDLVIQSDDSILLTGSSHNGSNYDFAVVRYDSAGTPDTNFSTDGIVTLSIGSNDEVAHSIALQSDGKIVVAGYSFNSSNDDFAIARILTTGIIDTTFDSDGVAQTPIGSQDESIWGVVIDSLGKIVVSGYTENGSNHSFAVARYLTNGSIDTTFSTDGVAENNLGSVSNDVAYSVVVQSDGKIIAGGTSIDTTGSYFGLVRFLTNGIVDTTYNSDGVIRLSVDSQGSDLYRLLLLSDGRVIAVGRTMDIEDRLAAVRFLTTGALDTTFSSDGVVLVDIGSGTDIGRGAFVSGNDKLYVTASSSNGSNFDFGIARFLTNGIIDTTFDGDGKAVVTIGSGDDQAFAIAKQGNGRVVIGGSTAVGTELNFGIGRILQ